MLHEHSLSYTGLHASNEQQMSEDATAAVQLQVMNRWLAVRIDFISNIVVFATAILVSVVLPVNAGLAGLAITAAINLTDNLSWFVRMVSSRLHAHLHGTIEWCLHDSLLLPTRPESYISVQGP